MVFLFILVIQKSQHHRISSEISYPVLNTYEDRIITTVFIFSTVKLILSV